MASACSGGQRTPTGESRGLGPGGEKGASTTIVVVLEGLDRSWISHWGGPPGLTPALDELARRSSRIWRLAADSELVFEPASFGQGRVEVGENILHRDQASFLQLSAAMGRPCELVFLEWWQEFPDLRIDARLQGVGELVERLSSHDRPTCTIAFDGSALLPWTMRPSLRDRVEAAGFVVSERPRTMSHRSMRRSPPPPQQELALQAMAVARADRMIEELLEALPRLLTKQRLFVVVVLPSQAFVPPSPSDEGIADGGRVAYWLERAAVDAAGAGVSDSEGSWSAAQKVESRDWQAATESVELDGDALLRKIVLGLAGFDLTAQEAAGLEPLLRDAGGGFNP